MHLTLELAKAYLDGGGTQLEHFKSIEDSAARALAECTGNSGVRLDLSGLDSLTETAAKGLAMTKGFKMDLNLSGLKSLSETAAIALSKAKWSCLDLSGLESLGDALAQALARTKGEKYDLVLSGLKSLSQEAAIALANSGWMTLNISGLTSLSSEAAQALSGYKGALNLSGLVSLSDAAAEALAKHHDVNASEKIKGLLSSIKNRFGSVKLAQARMVGATLLRTVWEGHGDDGCFSHHFFRHRRRIKFDQNIDEEVVAILNANNCSWSGNGEGSVGVLEIDLTTGKCCWREAWWADKLARLAEFLLRCEWVQTLSIDAEIKILVDEDGYPEVEIIKIQTVPAASKASIKHELGWLLNYFDYIEDDKTGIAALAEKLGESVSLTVDVATRNFAFRGQGKKASLSVPADVLEIKYFDVDLGIRATGTTSAVKRPTN